MALGCYALLESADDRIDHRLRQAQEGLQNERREGRGAEMSQLRLEPTPCLKCGRVVLYAQRLQANLLGIL